MKIPKSTLGLLIIAVCVVAVLGLRAMQSRGPLFSGAAKPAMTKGNPGARVQILEHIDFQCHVCGDARNILNEYMRKYPNDIYLEVQLFPLKGHEHGFSSALYAQCAADQHQFWPMYDALFEAQDFWHAMNPGGARATFRAMAEKLPINMQRFDACLGDAETGRRIMAIKAQGVKKGVRATPTLYVNGEMMVGPRPLRKALEKIFGDGS